VITVGKNYKNVKALIQQFLILSTQIRNRKKLLITKSHNK